MLHKWQIDLRMLSLHSAPFCSTIENSMELIELADKKNKESTTVLGVILQNQEL